MNAYIDENVITYSMHDIVRVKEIDGSEDLLDDVLHMSFLKHDVVVSY